MSTETVDSLAERLQRIEAALEHLIRQRTVKDWYSTQELSELVGKSEYTCREWCRQGRIRAEKKRSGRGKFFSWVISRDEVARIEREGLLPVARQ